MLRQTLQGAAAGGPGAGIAVRAEPSRLRDLSALGPERPDGPIEPRVEGFVRPGHQRGRAGQHSERRPQAFRGADELDQGAAPVGNGADETGMRVGKTNWRLWVFHSRTNVPRNNQGDPRPSLRLHHQPGPRSHQQRLATGATPLRGLSKENQRLSKRMGREVLCRHSIGRRNRAKTIHPSHRRPPNPPGPLPPLRRLNATTRDVSNYSVNVLLSDDRRVILLHFTRVIDFEPKQICSGGF